MLKHRPKGATHWQAGYYYNSDECGIWSIWENGKWHGNFKFPDGVMTKLPEEKEPAMSEFKVGQILVKRNTFNQPSKSTSLWKVVYVYADAVEVVPLKDGKELKMLQGIYGSAMFNPASTEEIAAGHRIDKPSDSRELETLDKLENHISQLCKTIGDQS
ncbi:hypothetical protein KNR53_17890 [Acinetobacter baumannii]|nr:hypothetical protein [Acinetobacter baumannii]MCO9081966.1 hypothetical protein [Acinetobacter baumannii]MCO9088087.1 hypothetical protein [Acinetobacter baumannii]MCO9091921.1 hypothetical protein [Acinetobacter baumannii]MCO9095702.1 hypothetical protein [Acinetobacter baumannii]